MVYDWWFANNYRIHGTYKPTNITGGSTLYESRFITFAQDNRTTDNDKTAVKQKVGGVVSQNWGPPTYANVVYQSCIQHEMGLKMVYTGYTPTMSIEWEIWWSTNGIGIPNFRHTQVATNAFRYKTCMLHLEKLSSGCCNVCAPEETELLHSFQKPVAMGCFREVLGTQQPTYHRCLFDLG